MTIAVDFDGTIVTHEYPRIGKPIPFAIETLKRLQQEGHHQLILWTCREGELLQEAIDYCAAKGLEFPNVFLVGFEEGLFPGMRAIGDGSEMEEERRLMYVAVTRAKKELFISATVQRTLFGMTNFSRNSRYLFQSSRLR